MNDHHHYGGVTLADELHVAGELLAALNLEFRKNPDPYGIDLVCEVDDMLFFVEVEGANERTWNGTERPPRWRDFSLPLRRFSWIDRLVDDGFDSAVIKVSACREHWIMAHGSSILERVVNEGRLFERRDELVGNGLKGVLDDDGQRAGYSCGQVFNSRDWDDWDASALRWMQHSFVCFPWGDPRLILGKVRIIRELRQTLAGHGMIEAAS